MSQSVAFIINFVASSTKRSRKFPCDLVFLATGVGLLDLVAFAPDFELVSLAIGVGLLDLVAFAANFELVLATGVASFELPLVARLLASSMRRAL